MPGVPLLEDIVNALEMPFDEMPSFLDLDSGQVESVSRDMLRKAEADSGEGEPAHFSDWEKDDWKIAKRIVSTDRFVPLPTNFDLDEWQIMEDFTRTVTSESIRRDL